MGATYPVGISAGMPLHQASPGTETPPKSRYTPKSMTQPAGLAQTVITIIYRPSQHPPNTLQTTTEIDNDTYRYATTTTTTTTTTATPPILAFCPHRTSPSRVS